MMPFVVLQQKMTAPGRQYWVSITLLGSVHTRFSRKTAGASPCASLIHPVKRPMTHGAIVSPHSKMAMPEAASIGPKGM